MNNYIEVEGKAVNKKDIVKIELGISDFNAMVNHYYKVKVTYLDKNEEKRSGWIRINEKEMFYLYGGKELVKDLLDLLPSGTSVITVEPIDRFGKRVSAEEDYSE